VFGAGGIIAAFTNVHAFVMSVVVKLWIGIDYKEVSEGQS